MKKILHLLIALFFIAGNGFAQDACRQRIETHLRIVGDSWAQFPVIYEAYDSALAMYGFPDYISIGDGTTLISMTAETWWQFPLARVALEASLRTDVNRSIDVVLVSLGGNDVAFKIHAGDSLNVLDNNLYNSKLLMDSIFDLIHQTHLDAQIIWQCYDFPNFNDPCIDFPWDPYCDLWQSHGYPTPYQINRFLTYIGNYQDSVIQNYHLPYMHYFNNLGLMQWKFGQISPLRYAPFGSYPPRSVPFPGGNLNYPSPHPAMGLAGVDTYHLNQQGFTYLAEFYMRKFISNYFRRNRDTTIHSMGQTSDGWVTATGTTGTGEVLVGKQTGQVNTKGVFSFNTSVIPADKNVKKAAIFFKEKTIAKPFPLRIKFPDNFSLDIKTGTFGNEVIEDGDYAATASMSDVACFAGSLRGNEYTLRADIMPDALKYINKDGITQFRLEISDDNLINFYNGDTAELEGPYLDIYYDTLSITTNIINKQVVNPTLQVYPNPANDIITLKLGKEWLYKKSVVTIYNTQGAIISSINYNKIDNEELKLDIKNLADGGYFISIANDENKQTGTFVKLK